MQVSVEAIGELGRKITVQVPEERIRDQVESRLQSLAREAKFDGFRPGKVPATLIRKRYGQKVRQEVLGDLIESSFQQAVQVEKLRPAGVPEIVAQEADEGKGLKYEAAFEVFPDFVPMPLETLEVRRFVSTVTDQDVDGMLHRLREQRRTWRGVDRGAADGDRVTICFEGSVGEESFTNGRIEKFPVLLGSGQFVPGFEDRLLGATAGAELAFDLEFPGDYTDDKLAGKLGHFHVEVVQVEEGVLPEVDAEFAKSFGIEEGDLDAFRNDVRGNMEREMNRALKSRTKTAVLDALFERNPISLPGTLVNAELRELLTPLLDAAQKRHQEIDEGALKANYEPIARRRVALALILSRIIEVNRLKVDPKRVRETVEDLARSYETPEQVVHWYYANRDHLREVENLVLEDQVVELILEKAQVRDESVNFQELMQPSGQTGPISHN